MRRAEILTIAALDPTTVSVAVLVGLLEDEDATVVMLPLVVPLAELLALERDEDPVAEVVVDEFMAMDEEDDTDEEEVVSLVQPPLMITDVPLIGIDQLT